MEARPQKSLEFKVFTQDTNTHTHAHAPAHTHTRSSCTKKEPCLLIDTGMYSILGKIIAEIRYSLSVWY